MNIILEGPDGSGKSTLAKQLAALLNMEVVHFEYPGEGVNQFELFKGFIKEHTNTILDRAWYSDMIYGPVFRKKAEIDVDMMWQLEYHGLMADTVLIYCTGDPALMYEQALKRGETYFDNYKQYKAVHTLYEDLMRNERHYMRPHIREATWLK